MASSEIQTYQLYLITDKEFGNSAWFTSNNVQAQELHDIHILKYHRRIQGQAPSVEEKDIIIKCTPKQKDSINEGISLSVDFKECEQAIFQAEQQGVTVITPHQPNTTHVDHDNNSLTQEDYLNGFSTSRRIKFKGFFSRSKKSTEEDFISRLTELPLTSPPAKYDQQVLKLIEEFNKDNCSSSFKANLKALKNKINPQPAENKGYQF